MLASLVAKQLVRLRGDRYWMLETIHQFAQGRLAEAPDVGDLERRHGEWFAAVSDAAYDDMYEQWMPADLVQRLGEDQRNFEVAIDRAVGRGDLDCALRAMVTFEGVYESRGLTTAWREMLEQIFDSASPEVIAGVMTARRNTLECLNMLIEFQAVQGDMSGARARAESYLELARAQQNIELEAWMLYTMALIETDDPRSAREMFLRARELAAATDDPRPILPAWIGSGLALAELDLGDYTSARLISTELANADDKFTSMIGLQSLVLAELAMGNAAQARAAVVRDLEGHGASVQSSRTCWILAALSAADDPELAALFIGAGGRIETQRGAGDLSGRFERSLRAETADSARMSLGADTFDRLRSEGRETPLHLLLDRAKLPSYGASAAPEASGS